MVFAKKREFCAVLKNGIENFKILKKSKFKKCIYNFLLKYTKIHIKAKKFEKKDKK